jgi:hypothetical protein
MSATIYQSTDHHIPEELNFHKYRSENLKCREVTGDWRRLHNEALPDCFSSPNIILLIKDNEIGGACSTYGGEEKWILGCCGRT